MGRSWFSTVLLLWVILFFLLPSGFGRRIVTCFGHDEHAVADSYQGRSREMMELDYVDAGPNVNAKSGYLFPSPPPPPPPPLD